MVVADALMLTDGMKVGLTVMFTALELTEAGLAQFNEEVITTVTTSPFASDEL